MTDATVTFLLDNIKQLLAQKLDVLAKADEELKQLRNKLQGMKSMLDDNARKKFKSNYLLTWESQIRSIVYQAEDLIDDYISNTYSKKGSMIFAKATKKIDLAEAVNALLNKEITDVLSKDNWELANIKPPEETYLEARKAGVRLRQRASQIDKPIVGFGDVIEALIKDLTKPSSEVEAISIIGMAGLGKTTVALKIFNHRRIKSAFPTRIWITVSESHDARDIYMTIIKHFKDEDNLLGLSEIDLAGKAREHLKGAVFLLVADDVWTSEAWKAIKLALPLPSQSPSSLPSDEITSKVLVTSRIAVCTNPNRRPHHLRFLTNEESWELLQREVYGRANLWPEELTEIGSSIAEKCDGLPLALVMVGGILWDKFSEDISERKREWEKISNAVEEHLFKGEENSNNMGYMISLNYDELPYEYRECFLYLSVFPEDYDVSAWKLTRLWVAEGFIRNGSDTDLSMEEVAEDILSELIKRSLVTVTKKNTRGEVKRIRVHDVIRQYCKKEAKKLDLIREIRFVTNHGVFAPPLSDIGEFRRISVHSAVVEFLMKKPPITKARSFICFSKEGISIPTDSLSEVFNPFRFIRVFEGSSILFPKFTPALSQLIHLRYLTLSIEESSKRLPESICSLWCLQTLVITTSSESLDVKNIFGLKLLRHVKTKAAIVLGEKKSKIRSSFSSSSSSSRKSVEVNEDLQTLTRLSTKSCTKEVLARAPNLKTLGIRGDIDSILDTTFLTNLKLVSKLKLKNDRDAKTKLKNLKTGVLSSTFFPPNLKSLTLEATCLEWTHMVTLGTLTKLEALKLKDNAFKGETWDFDSDGFNSLECLHIDGSDLTDWTVSENSFGKLKHLIIKGCKNLKNVPSHLVTKLETLDFERVSKEAVEI